MESWVELRQIEICSHGRISNMICKLVDTSLSSLTQKLYCLIISLGYSVYSTTFQARQFIVIGPRVMILSRNHPRTILYIYIGIIVH